MKIAIFSDCYLDLTGGIVTSINLEKATLEARGHTVYVFSSAYPRSASERKKLSKKHIYPVPSCRMFGRGATPIARRPAVIEKWLLKNHPEIVDFDIYYIHYEAGCSIAGLRLGHRLRIPTVQVMHGREDVGEANLIPRGLRTLVAVLLNWFHSWYLPHPVKIRRDNYLARTIAAARMWTLMVNHANAANLVLAPSEHFRDKLKHYNVTRPCIALHHGLPATTLSRAATVRELTVGEPLRIIWHSRVSGEKRILPFLAALSLLAPDSYHLDVFGDGPDAPAAKKYARRHRLSVTFYGAQPLSVIYNTLSRAHLDVLVSYGYDTFGMTLIEAAATGAPAFIVDPDLAEVIPAGGYAMSTPTPAAMAATLQNLIAHPEQISAMSAVMLAARQGLSLEQKIARLEKIFASLPEPPELVKKSSKKSTKMLL